MQLFTEIGGFVLGCQRLGGRGGGAGRGIDTGIAWGHEAGKGRGKALQSDVKKKNARRADKENLDVFKYWLLGFKHIKNWLVFSVAVKYCETFAFFVACCCITLNLVVHVKLLGNIYQQSHMNLIHEVIMQFECVFTLPP